jgi:hypothetical protein
MADKPPYKLTIKLDGAKAERVAEALTQLRECASDYDQTGDASATLTIEAHQERPLHTLVADFEEWLYRNAQGLDVDIKLQRPGIRPETMAMRAREKHSPMDRVAGFDDGDEPVDSTGAKVLSWLEAREQG